MKWNILMFELKACDLINYTGLFFLEERLVFRIF